MGQPRTYAELQQQWLRRVMPDAELPDARAEVSRQVLRATIDQLQRALERDAGTVMDAARAVGVAPVAGSQEVAALIDVARTARTVRGPGSQYIEEAALRALVDIADESVLPFLAECFRFTRPHDGSAGHRRSIVLRGIATIAVLSSNAEALALLEEALTHKTPRVRLAACRALADVAGLARVGLPAVLAARLDHVARQDHARDVRVSAALALEAAGTPAGGAWTGRSPSE